MTPLDKLKIRFHGRIIRGNEEYARAIHPPKKFRAWIAAHGAVWACKKVFNDAIVTGHRPEHDGFTAAFLAGRLDLTAEYLVWDETEWRPLFLPEEHDHLRITARLFNFEEVRMHRALVTS